MKLTEIDLRCGPNGLPAMDADETQPMIEGWLTAMDTPERVRVRHSIRTCADAADVNGLGEQGIAELMQRIGLLDAIICERKARELAHAERRTIEARLWIVTPP